jgi:hypothetical protein
MIDFQVTNSGDLCFQPMSELKRRCWKMILPKDKPPAHDVSNKTFCMMNCLEMSYDYVPFS